MRPPETIERQKATIIGSATITLTNNESGTTNSTPKVVNNNPFAWSFIVVFNQWFLGVADSQHLERENSYISVVPILIGLANPTNDLSRGYSAEDVLNMIAITVNQVGQAENP